MHLSELKRIQDKEERNKALYRAFAPDSGGVEVAGKELSALVVLLNLTTKKADVSDLIDPVLAKTVLADLKHFEFCIRETRWFHSHNLKYPNAKVSKQRLLTSRPERLEGGISSAHFPERRGWSHDSQKVRLANLFCSEFLWNGSWTCLASVVLGQECEWRKAFLLLGFTEERWNKSASTIKSLMEEDTIPSSVSPYSPQVQMPYAGGYIAITPVVSHSVQCSIQQLARTNNGKFWRLSHDHPASIGSLVACRGGRVCALFYPPATSAATRSLHGYRLDRLKAGHPVFDTSVITNKHSRKTYQNICHDKRGLTLKRRRRQRVMALRQLRRVIAAWLLPVIELREQLSGRESELEELSQNSCELKLITLPTTYFPELVNPLLRAFNEHLQQSRAARKFAFDADLMGPLRTQIRWVLNYLSFEKEAQNEVRKKSYLYLSNLRVFDANAMANPYLCGIPSLTALWGMCHRYERNLNDFFQFAICVEGIAFHIRRYSLVEGRKLPEPSRWQRGELKRPGIIASQRCDMVVDVVLELGFEEGNALNDRDTQLFQAALPQSLAGGSIHPPSLYEQKNWCDLHHSQLSLFDTIVGLPAEGCWVAPAKASVNSVHDLMDAIADNSALKPVMTGYQLLESPCRRGGAHCEQHAYAEPVLGLANCVSPTGVRFGSASSFFSRMFWQLEVAERSMLMKLRTNL